jgi:hypothetical protein
MRQWVFDHQQPVLCVLLLLASGTTLVCNRRLSPTGQLIPSKIGRRFPGVIGALWLIVPALLPLYYAAAGLTALVVELLFASWLLALLWLVRALGEEDYLAMLERAARKSSPAALMVPAVASVSCVGLVGGVVLFFYPDPRRWAFYPAIGMVIYSAIMATKAIRDAAWIFRRIRAPNTVSPAVVPVEKS